MISLFFDICIDILIVSLYNNSNNIVFKIVSEGCFMLEANLLLRAINETVNIKPKEVFLVKELFRGHEWNCISKSKRLLLGILFLKYIKRHSDIVNILGKSTIASKNMLKRKPECLNSFI